MKPDDIPQDVWDRAEADASEYVEWLIPAPEEYEQSEFVLSQVIARAILAAEQRERERCAQVAFRAAQHVNASADDIATAIRKDTP